MMREVGAINIETGDFVMYNHETKTQKIVHKAEDIFCSGETWHGVHAASKKQVQGWESIPEPELVYADWDLIVMNTGRDKSVVIANKRIDLDWEVLYVHATPDDYAVVGKNKILFICDGRFDGIEDHHIPHIEESVQVFDTSAYSDMFISLYVHGEIRIYDLKHTDRWPIIYTICKTTTNGNLVMLECYDNLVVLIDDRTGKSCTSRISFSFIDEGFEDFALNNEMCKFYMSDGTILVNGSIRLEADKYTPTRARTQTKSANTNHTN